MAARIVFAGTPDFAVPGLDALVEAGVRPVAVFTQPDRPAGRGRRLTPPPVKRAAERHGLGVHQPERLGAEEAEQIRALAPDLMVVVAYGQILRRNVLDVPRFGCVNVHASLLPRWRGAAPIQRALLAGDEQTGVTLMQMDEGLDTGPMLARKATPISADETAGSLHDRLARIGADLLVAHLPEILAGAITPEPQPDDGVTYAAKLTNDESWLDPTEPAEQLERRVRALAPVPGARLQLGETPVRVLAARACAGRPEDRAGTVAAVGSGGIEVATGEGRLEITRLKPAGGREQTAADYLNGRRLVPGEPVQ
ncbi:methionyl-tRNA formyltransferase [Halorhodospira halophila]|uniref:Methionyl-tRNA formyltransferase n=1 Tax=Halorhodospira halophila (strain DSM 244 / SL1) TaxID=349124 RepID=FMT_HALHL|nr:methionyl-tRNA formyltransferase [Halorhodospira halophila]A1WZH3.1 RecName: Full=Methionyl-tRNA formyltransferase [Halorhodospira halophila SL1]ABM63085.1 methionyl-tRNA formyltransferase [Halorhodospira halophila SL1]MBK1727793.1 methionyl-tRNA formyltransferase [Halorhodospira halophila]